MNLTCGDFYLFNVNTGSTRPQAYGVIYKDTNEVMHRAYLIPNLKSEIILSSGAIGSPQLLMLSGIGPSDHLKVHGIEIVLDQPMVGKGMADNPMNVLFIPSPLPVETSLIQVVGITRSDSYIEAAGGLGFAYSWVHSLSQSFELFQNQVLYSYFNYSKQIHIITSFQVLNNAFLEI